MARNVRTGYDDWFSQERKGKSASEFYDPDQVYTHNAVHLTDGSQERIVRLEKTLDTLTRILDVAEGNAEAIDTGFKLLKKARAYLDKHHIEWQSLSQRWFEAVARLEYLDRNLNRDMSTR